MFLIALATTALMAVGSSTTVRAQVQASGHAADAAAIMQADAAFAAAVAAHDRARFLTFIADVTTFNGGTANEIRGRDAVMKSWSDFFDPDGPTLTWAPTSAAVIGAGDLGYSTGSSVLKGKDAKGALVERRGEYLTVWRKQADGAWRVVFDTGSTLPAATLR
jgi:ketosteroid isomerase-like protein